MEFSCGHDDEHPTDCCLSITYSDDAIESAQAFTPLAGSPVRRQTTRHASSDERSLVATPPTPRMEALAGAWLCSLATMFLRQYGVKPSDGWRKR
jgi:hypothetical protein